MNKTLTTLIAVLLIGITYAQRPQGGARPEVTITGKVIDLETNQPLEYATVAFFSKQQNKIIPKLRNGFSNVVSLFIASKMSRLA